MNLVLLVSKWKCTVIACGIGDTSQLVARIRLLGLSINVRSGMFNWAAKR